MSVVLVCGREVPVRDELPSRLQRRIPDRQTSQPRTQRLQTTSNGPFNHTPQSSGTQTASQDWAEPGDSPHRSELLPSMQNYCRLTAPSQAELARECRTDGRISVNDRRTVCQSVTSHYVTSYTITIRKSVPLVKGIRRRHVDTGFALATYAKGCW